jgi:hypothetical protein
VGWIGGPGGLEPNPQPWSQVASAYAWIDTLVALRSRVVGVANLARFDRWLSSFQYMRALAQSTCQWAVYNGQLANVLSSSRDPHIRQQLAPKLNGAREDLVANFTTAVTFLQQTIVRCACSCCDFSARG